MIVRRPLLVANPQAGSFPRRHALQSLIDSFTRHFPDGRVLLSLPEPPSDEFFEKYADRDLLIVYGGDGSVHRIVQFRPPSWLPILVLPGGTGNVLSQYLGTSRLQKNPDFLWKNLHRGRVRSIRPGVVGARRFILMAGAGWDGHAVGFVSWKPLIGTLAYYKAGLHALLSRNLPDFSLTLVMADGRTVELNRVRWCLASRLPLYLGFLQPPMQDEPDATTLHVTIVQGMRWGIITTFAGFLPGIQKIFPPLSFRVKRVHFTLHKNTTPLPFQADGEAIPPAAFFGVAPETLTFLSFPKIDGYFKSFF